MTVVKACPRCRNPMEIPEPPPEMLRCPRCGAVSMTAHSSAGTPQAGAMAAGSPPVASAPLPPGGPPPTPVAPPARSSVFGLLVVVGLLGGGLLFAVVAVAAVALAPLLFNEEKKADDPSAQAAQGPAVQEVNNNSAVPAKPVKPEPPPLPPKIQRAVDRGVAHLKKRLLEPGEPLATDKRFVTDTAVGAQALAGLALLEARVPHDDPAVQKALAAVREGSAKLSMVYALGASLFFLNRLDEAARLTPADREMARTLALRLLAGQRPEGYWTYQNPPITPETEKDLVTKLQDNTYTPRNTNTKTLASNSMTQFALLSLWGSRRHDLPVRRALLISATHFHASQGMDGTWPYNVTASKGKIVQIRIDSNTCAGLIALAMEKALREDKAFRINLPGDPPADARGDDQCEKAFAHLAKVIGRPKIERDEKKFKKPLLYGKIITANAWGDYYFLWCLERVAVIYDKKEIGGKDWYGWGSEIILQNQRDDGSWFDGHGDVPDTCFALLFLMRANLAKDLTESIRARAN